MCQSALINARALPAAHDAVGRRHCTSLDNLSRRLTLSLSEDRTPPWSLAVVRPSWWRKLERSARNDLSERTVISNPPEGRPGGRNVPDFRLVAVKFQGVDHNNFKGFHAKGKALTS